MDILKRVAAEQHAEYMATREAFVRVYLEQTRLTVDDIVMCSKPSLGAEERLWFEKKTEFDRRKIPTVPVGICCPECGHEIPHES